MASLLLGCGQDRTKKLHFESSPDWNGDLTTLDMNPDCGADVVWNLDEHPLPFEDDSFDEMGAFDVLEHVGKLGDWKGYFAEFAEYWRILKNGGLFFIIVPTGPDTFADPGHTRFFNGNWFHHLNQKWYADRIASKVATTDYRWAWKKNFDVLDLQHAGDHHITVILRKA